MRCCHSACMPPWQILQRKRAVPDLVPLLTKFVYEISGVLLVLAGGPCAVACVQAADQCAARPQAPLADDLRCACTACGAGSITLLAFLVILEALGIFHGAWALDLDHAGGVGDRVRGRLERAEQCHGGDAAADLPAVSRGRSRRSAGVQQRLSDRRRGAGHEPDVHDLAAHRPAYAAGRYPVDQPEGDPPLVRVPNNLFFQRPLRTQSRHASDSKLPFFSRPKG